MYTFSSACTPWELTVLYSFTTSLSIQSFLSRVNCWSFILLPLSSDKGLCSSVVRLFRPCFADALFSIIWLISVKSFHCSLSLRDLELFLSREHLHYPPDPHRVSDFLAPVARLERGYKDLLLWAGSSFSQAIAVGLSLHDLCTGLYLCPSICSLHATMLSPDATTWLISSFFSTWSVVPQMLKLWPELMRFISD